MSHHHEHRHATNNIRVAFFLNLGFALIEMVGGVLTNSTAILSDAVHDLGDSISLGMAWFLGNYSEKEGTQDYTYGYRRYSLLGALINSIVLISGGLYVLSEAIPRLINPEQFDAQGTVLIAILGVVINGAAVLRLRSSQSLNAQVVTWHLLEDVLGWIAVLIMGIISIFVNLPILDPILSTLITLYVLYNAIRNLRKTTSLFLQASPKDVDLQSVEHQLAQIDGVTNTHHTHMWSLDGEHHVFTSHLVVKQGITVDEIIEIKKKAREAIQDLHLEHATIEIEFNDEDCTLPEQAHEHEENHEPVHA